MHVNQFGGNVIKYKLAGFLYSFFLNCHWLTVLCQSLLNYHWFTVLYQISAVQQSDSVYTYRQYFFILFSIMVYHRTLNIAPCIMQ